MSNDEMLRKIQLCEYDILKELDRICKKHNIKYFLGQGTLLGAAKYKKFIPWDDDIDLLIPYKELKKLVKVFESDADKKYLLTNCFLEKHFPVAWTKIRNKDTLSRPVNYKDIPINWGICIDLFPIYPLSDFAPLRKIERFFYRVANKMLYAEFTKYEDEHGMLARLLEKVPLWLRHFVLRCSIGIMNIHSDKTKFVLVASKAVNVVEREMLFGKEAELMFEEQSFPGVSDWDGYLTLYYGDWRADLPPELQKGHDLTMGQIEWKL